MFYIILSLGILAVGCSDKKKCPIVLPSRNSPYIGSWESGRVRIVFKPDGTCVEQIKELAPEIKWQQRAPYSGMWHEVEGGGIEYVLGSASSSERSDMFYLYGKIVNDTLFEDHGDYCQVYIKVRNAYP